MQALCSSDWVEMLRVIDEDAVQSGYRKPHPVACSEPGPLTPRPQLEHLGTEPNTNRSLLFFIRNRKVRLEYILPQDFLK